MTIEAHIIGVLEVGLSAPVYYGIAPQKQTDDPIDLPVVIVNRIASQWFSEFNGTDTALADTMIQVDFYHSGAADARRLADKARAALSQDASVPILESEMSQFDDGAKAWRVMQTWRVPEYEPALSETIT